jgi:putative transposase
MEHEGFAELANIEDNLIIRDASNGASMLQISDGNSHQFRPSITFQLSVSFASCLQACFFRHLSHLHLFLERWLGGGVEIPLPRGFFQASRVPLCSIERNLCCGEMTFSQKTGQLKNGISGKITTLKEEIFAMKKTKFTEEQIAFALKQAETGTSVQEVIRKLGISEQTFYNWKKKYGGLGPSELRRLKQLEEENHRLKRMVADLSLDKQMLQDVLSKKL